MKDALKLALDDLMVEYDMERTSFAKRVDEIFKQAIAAQPAPVQDPVATVIKKGADRQWMSERLGSLPDGIYSLYTTPPAAPVQGWINPNDKIQRKFLPDIGDKVFFCNGGRVYYGHHTGGGFRTGQGAATKYFGTWDCYWMPIPPAHGITEKGQP
jgi:hypothetical protein